MNKVYVVGVMQIDLSNDEYQNNSKRLWYFFANLKDAELSVFENWGDMFEGYYNLALIEEHWVYDPKDRATTYHSATQWWYQVDHFTSYDDGNNPVITKLDQPPKCFHNVVNFWAG